MKIVFVGLSSIFTEGMKYQDNLLANQVRTDGHDVTVIADCHKYQKGAVVETPEENRILDNGIRLRRLKYRNIIGKTISGKVRAVSGLFEILESEKPDVIFHHGMQSFELLTVATYKKQNAHVKLFVDNHADFNNSATNWLSMNILHRLFYKNIIRKALPFIDKVFFVTYECHDFLKELYDIPEELMEFYPLGGIVPDKKDRQARRTQIRKNMKLKEQEILLVHSGKMDALKRTEEIIEAFVQVPSNRLHLVLVGSIGEQTKNRIDVLIAKDERIVFLGWKTGEELLDILCACDLYVQPGSQSATMQNALCCGSSAALYPHPSHKHLLGDSVFYVETVEDMKELFANIANNPQLIESKRVVTQRLARTVLDYKVLASRLY